MNPIAFLTFLTSIGTFFNILGDDIGFEEKNRMSYMLSRGSSPRYQRGTLNCKQTTFSSYSSCSPYACTSCTCLNFCCLTAQECNLSFGTECRLACYTTQFSISVEDCFTFRFSLCLVDTILAKKSYRDRVFQRDFCSFSTL